MAGQPEGIELRLVRELSEINARLAVVESTTKDLRWLTGLVLGGVVSAVLGAVLYASGIGRGG